jgi:hypothetical protein
MFGSDNASSADNQQERLDSYLAGYVDGEGSFHVGIQKSRNVSIGYQLVPELHVSQNSERNQVLRILRKTLGCGYIKPNHPGMSKDKTDVFVVRNREDLLNKVIPFFESNPLLSPKQKDFEKFSLVVKAMDDGKHLETNGFLVLLRIAFSMNGNGRYRKFDILQIEKDLESSETIRQSPVNPGKI